MLKFVYDGGVFVYSYRAEKRHFLFLRNGRGWLDIPKGHAEKGERIMDTALRETKEETGLDVVPDRFFRHSLAYWTKEDGQRAKKIVTVFIAEVPQAANVRVSDEHVGYVWLSCEDALRQVSFKDTKELVMEADSYLDRKARIEKLNREYRKLPSKVKGWDLSANFVAGEGPPNAKVAVIGQAPGRSEDASGRPFVGRSGQLLTKLLMIAGLRREQVYITSVVQFFPPKNRVPSDKEIALCRGFLYRQLDIIKPRLVVVLGGVALKELLGIGEIMKVHGRLMKKDRNYFITLHPAAAVRIKSNVPIIESDFRKLKGALSSL
ncbi:MAG: NUDIX domain-containing protein [Candidatus Marsarchaeota archaeon]|jgi:DNA polymerase|nr:NUDIX domain-containing protein [Candidatus Marsarchaeota archaeon]MCL5111791.1 NUDIX domain-containing protein [Candidatus Marsarchaeota archaeon]